MRGDNLQENEEFISEIDSAVEDFFSDYEGNVPQPGGSPTDSASDDVPDEDGDLELDKALETFELEEVSEEENVLEVDEPEQMPEPDTVLEEELVFDMDDSMETSESDDAPGEESAFQIDGPSQTPESDSAPEKQSEPLDDDASIDPLLNLLEDTEESSSEGGGSASGHRASDKTKKPAKAMALFNSLTEAILTIDWEVNDTNVGKASDVLKQIQAAFPVLKESRAQEMVDAMMTILEAIAVSPQRVPMMAPSKLEKAISILRGMAAGDDTEDGYDALIEDAITGLMACKPKDEPVENRAAASQSPTPSIEMPLDESITTSAEAETAGSAGRVAPKAGEPAPVNVPPGISQALRRHSEVVALLKTRVRRLSDMYAAAQGAESMKGVLQKIDRLLELQEFALQDAFSLNCTIAVFPIGQVKNLSEFIGFQRNAAGVCLKYVRALESNCKRQPRLGKGRQSIYLLRIALEKQIDALSRAARGKNAVSRKRGATDSVSLSDVVREHLREMDECMERASFIAECKEEYDHEKIVEAGKLLREKIARQMDLLQRSLG